MKMESYPIDSFKNKFIWNINHNSRVIIKIEV